MASEKVGYKNIFDCERQILVAFKGDNRPDQAELTAYFSKFSTSVDFRYSHSLTTTIALDNSDSADSACKTPVVKLEGGTIFIKKVASRSTGVSIMRRQSAFALNSEPKSKELSKFIQSRRGSVAIIELTNRHQDRLGQLEDEIIKFDNEIGQSLKENEENRQHVDRVHDIMNEIDEQVLENAARFGEVRSFMLINKTLIKILVGSQEDQEVVGKAL